MTRALSLFLLLIASPAFAQVELVASVKAQLEAQRVDLSGSCGAFQITKRVAWALRQGGAGLLSKPSGNNCEGFSVDFITYPDGSGVDILGDSGGANVSGWDQSEPPGALSGRWRAPIDPAAALPPPPPPPPTGTGGVVPLPPGTGASIFDATAIVQQMQRMEERQMRTENQVLIANAKLDDVKAIAADADKEIKEHRAGVQAVWLKVAAIGGPLVTGIGMWLKMRLQTPPAAPAGQ